jgi:hypothetical protein
MIPDILELHMRLQENRNRNDLVRTRTAAIQHATDLLKSKYSDGTRMFDDGEVSKSSSGPSNFRKSTNILKRRGYCLFVSGAFRAYENAAIGFCSSIIAKYLFTI